MTDDEIIEKLKDNCDVILDIRKPSELVQSASFETAFSYNIGMCLSFLETLTDEHSQISNSIIEKYRVQIIGKLFVVYNINGYDRYVNSIIQGLNTRGIIWDELKYLRFSF